MYICIHNILDNKCIVVYIAIMYVIDLTMMYISLASGTIAEGRKRLLNPNS